VLGLVRLTEELGGQEVIFIPLKPFGEDAAAQAYYRKHAFSPSEQAEVIREIYNIPTRLNIFYDEPFLTNLAEKSKLNISHSDSGVTITEIAGCASAHSLYIQTKGDVRPCMFSPPSFSFGNASSENLSEIWQRMQVSQVIQGWANRATRHGACSICPQFDCCHGCLARTYSLCRDSSASDPACPFVHGRY
jgi:radical SAM protein with 4Fe4S-binding SPASM domain